MGCLSVGNVANSWRSPFAKYMQGVATPVLAPRENPCYGSICPRRRSPYSHRVVLFYAAIASQEHLQGLRTQYRIRVEAMRKQVQQLTARHEVSKKELATSETVGDRGGATNRFGPCACATILRVIVTPHSPASLCDGAYLVFINLATAYRMGLGLIYYHASDLLIRVYSGLVYETPHAVRVHRPRSPYLSRNVCIPKPRGKLSKPWKERCARTRRTFSSSRSS